MSPEFVSMDRIFFAADVILAMLANGTPWDEGILLMVDNHDREITLDGQPFSCEEVIFAVAFLIRCGYIECS